jgi:hypothetical protein
MRQRVKRCCKLGTNVSVSLETRAVPSTCSAQTIHSTLPVYLSIRDEIQAALCALMETGSRHCSLSEEALGGLRSGIALCVRSLGYRVACVWCRPVRFGRRLASFSYLKLAVQK